VAEPVEATLSPRHLVILSSCHLVILSPRHLVILSSCHLVILSSYKDLPCQQLIGVVIQRVAGGGDITVFANEDGVHVFLPERFPFYIFGMIGWHDAIFLAQIVEGVFVGFLGKADVRCTIKGMFPHVGAANKGAAHLRGDRQRLWIAQDVADQFPGQIGVLRPFGDRPARTANKLEASVWPGGGRHQSTK